MRIKLEDVPLTIGAVPIAPLWGEFEVNAQGIVEQIVLGNPWGPGCVVLDAKQADPFRQSLWGHLKPALRQMFATEIAAHVANAQRYDMAAEHGTHRVSRLRDFSGAVA
jgi:hypothetical protein